MNSKLNNILVQNYKEKLKNFCSTASFAIVLYLLNSSHKPHAELRKHKRTFAFGNKETRSFVAQINRMWHTCACINY